MTPVNKPTDLDKAIYVIFGGRIRGRGHKVNYFIAKEQLEKAREEARKNPKVGIFWKYQCGIKLNAEDLAFLAMEQSKVKSES